MTDPAPVQAWQAAQLPSKMRFPTGSSIAAAIEEQATATKDIARNIAEGVTMPIVSADGCPIHVEVEGPEHAPVLMLSNSLGKTIWS